MSAPRHCPTGVEDLKAGQRVEFGLASGRRGPQALSVKLIEPPPSLARTRREATARPSTSTRPTNCTAWSRT